MEPETTSSVEILGVRVDKVNMNQAVEMVEEWIRESGRYYIVTPNPEFIMLAQYDEVFRTILNKSDLAIPDGSRLGWASSVLQEKNLFKKFLIWSTFLFPSKQLTQFDTIAGVDLMERLCRASGVWGSTIGLLGGKDGVAERTAECLQKRYKNLKVVFTDSGGQINEEGREDNLHNVGVDLCVDPQEGRTRRSAPTNRIPKCDILFVAFGQGKQEKWIAQNLKKLPVKVMMGVGGSFDEISGFAPKPPKIVSNLKLKWLFRLITEPWRAKRQLQLIKFLWLVLTK